MDIASDTERVGLGAKGAVEITVKIVTHYFTDLPDLSTTTRHVQLL
jgi:hypothetical protein